MKTAWAARGNQISDLLLKLELAWKLPPYWLDFTEPEGAVSAAGGEKPSMVYSAADPTCYYKKKKTLPGKVCVRWWNIGMPVMGLDKYFLLRCEDH